MKTTVLNEYNGGRDAVVVKCWLFQLDNYMAQNAEQQQLSLPLDSSKMGLRRIAVGR